MAKGITQETPSGFINDMKTHINKEFFRLLGHSAKLYPSDMIRVDQLNRPKNKPAPNPLASKPFSNIDMKR